MTTTATERAVLVRRWERGSEWPLMVAAVVFLAAYAAPILDLNLCRPLSWLTWGIFVVRLAEP
jgi:voltage-gated potassium channel